MATHGSDLWEIVTHGRKVVDNVVRQARQPLGPLIDDFRPRQEGQRSGIIVGGKSIGGIGNSGAAPSDRSSAGIDEQEYRGSGALSARRTMQEKEGR